MSHRDDRFYMGLALDLAQKGAGRTSPNPMVGCVVVRGGQIIGKGYHRVAGDPHAEVEALKGVDANGATLYVSLEPCSHHGRTPPCADLIIGAGVKRVVAAIEDPNPAVAGEGFSRLRDAGIEVDVGALAGRARRMNEAFLLSIVEKRAFVNLKLAATLDGRIATASGDSKWITSEESRLEVHLLRDRMGAIIVGVGTAITDNPRLTVRLPGSEERRILRVVIDPDLRADTDLDIFAPDEAAHTMVVCGTDAWEEAEEVLTSMGVQVFRCDKDQSGSLDLAQLLQKLYSMGIMEVMVEGGAATARTFIDRGLVDRFHLFYAPMILGGHDAIPMFAGMSPLKIADGLRLENIEDDRFGPDIYLTGTPVRR